MFALLSPLALGLALTVPAALQATPKPTAAALVDQARLFVPQFEGDHKYFLTGDEERDVRAAAKILEAAMALDPNNTVALWWHGHCSVLLGENEKNRGRTESGQVHYQAALDSFAAALKQDSSYYWARYSRAMAEANLGRFWAAIEDFDQAVSLADGVMAGGQADDWAPFVRFKARQWRADTRMRIFEFERAREEFRSFYADNGDNQWDLGYSLAETYLRESDLDGARAAYEAILADPEFVTFDSTYAELAYVAGLVGDQGQAVSRIEQALDREFQPTIYPRLWYWIFADGKKRSKVEADLAEFLEFPPDDLSGWDASLGRFLMGAGTPEAFLELARSEQERRMREAEALDDLMCEVWFYVGVRLERSSQDAQALGAYRRALAFRPAKHKWEWSFARSGFARLASDLARQPAPGFTVEGDRVTLAGEGPVNRVHGTLAGQVVSVTVHTPGQAQPRRPVPLALEGLRPGDLVRVTLRDDGGSMRALRIVVDAR